MNLVLSNNTTSDQLRDCVTEAVKAEKLIAKLSAEIDEQRKRAKLATDALNTMIATGLGIVNVPGYGKFVVGKSDLTKPLLLQRVDDLKK